MTELPAFDGLALIKALDAERAARRLDWNGLAEELWRQSSVLNTQQSSPAMCPGALARTAKRGTMSCQYALTLLRWIHRPPEDFLAGAAIDVGDTRLVDAGVDRRLRWDLPQLYAALTQRRRERRMTWAQLADELMCTPARLTNLRTARLADMGLAMRITQWLGQPAATFVHAVEW